MQSIQQAVENIDTIYSVNFQLDFTTLIILARIQSSLHALGAEKQIILIY